MSLQVAGGGGKNPSVLRTQGPERAAIAGPGARKAPRLVAVWFVRWQVRHLRGWFDSDSAWLVCLRFVGAIVQGMPCLGCFLHVKRIYYML